MSASTNAKYQDVIKANIALHSKLADHYNTCEPQFRPENLNKIDAIISNLVKETNATSLLDLGCGTGFIIALAKKYVKEIHGVDVTRAMMDKVDKTGPCKITLHECDTGSFKPESPTFDLVTGYSFLHHLYDVKPTLQTAYNALRAGGKAYFDLDPNFYFWNEINKLEREGNYDPIVKREIEMVTHKDEDIEKNFGVSPDIFNNAEYGKVFAGGFKEESVVEMLRAIGFSKVEFFYHWFIGQGILINDESYSKEARFLYAAETDKLLQKALPLSRNLFKYVGFIATK